MMATTRSDIPRMVGITRQERDVLWLQASFVVRGWSREVSDQFKDIHPCPVNDWTSKPPKPKKVRKLLQAVTDSVEFFSAVGWGPIGDRRSYTIPRELIPYLRFLVKEVVEELGDHSQEAVEKARLGNVEGGDYYPEGHRRRDHEDDLLEVAYVCWQTLGRFGIGGPLKDVPKVIGGEG